MCDDKVLVSEVNSEPSTSLCIRPSVKSFVLLYGFSVPFTLTLKVWKGQCLGKDFLFKAFLMGCGLKQIVFQIYVACRKLVLPTNAM